MSAAAAAAPAPETAVDVKFHKTLVTMLDQLSTPLPECDGIKGKLSLLTSGLVDNPVGRGTLVSQWKSNMSSKSLKMLRNRNPALFKVFDDHPLLSDLKMTLKWQSNICDQTRGAIWSYIEELTIMADPSVESHIRGSVTTSLQRSAPPPTRPAATPAPAAVGAPNPFTAAAMRELAGVAPSGDLVAAAERVKAKLGIVIAENGDVTFNTNRLMDPSLLEGDSDVSAVLQGSASLFGAMSHFQSGPSA